MSKQFDVPRSDWEWCGFPAHFICADKCQFHLATKVGDWIVSTVGSMVYDDEEYMEKFAKENPNGIMLEEVGANRFYETMVFRSKDAECECCEWEIDLRERYDYPNGFYQTAQEARSGHMEICEYIAKNQEVQK